MTNEEAIKAMTKYMPKDNDSVSLVLREAMNMGIKALEQEPSGDMVSRGVFEQIKWERDVAIEQLKELGYGLGEKPKTDFEHKAEIVISQLRADRDRLQDAIEKIKSEIKEWYWQADKQALAKDPCVVDAMVDLFIRTINKYKAESEE